MPTKPRSEILRPGEQAIVHTMNRCVRSSFLLGSDRKSGKNYSYRRRKFENELRKAARGFAIDLLSYSLMDNHFHLILRNRPDVVKEWSDAQVVKQWHMLCPLFKDKDGVPIEEPSEEELARVALDREYVAELRVRLSDISWFMKLISERMARWCNAEDDVKGHFWEGRFKGVLLLDERAMLACSVYVELNRLQAELAASIESSDFTSIQRRLQAEAFQTTIRHMLAEQFGDDTEPESICSVVLQDPAVSDIFDAVDASQLCDADYWSSRITANGLAARNLPASNTATSQPAVGAHSARLPDAHLSPVQIDERHDPIGPHLSSSQWRCSDKGFLPMSQAKYIELLRRSASQFKQHLGDQPLNDSPPLPEPLQIEPDVWYKLTTQFTDMFYSVAGTPEAVDSFRSLKTGKRFHMPQKTREMLAI